MGVLVLRPEDHAGLLTVGEGVQLMRQALETSARSPVKLSNPRTRTNTPEGFRMTVLQGVTPPLGACVIAKSERLEIQPNGRQRYPARGRPVHVLYDPRTAELLAILIGEPRPRGFEKVDAASGFLTACVAAVGTDLLARADARRVGILGSGGQARLHLAALASARPVDEAVVYSPTREHREAFAREMEATLAIPVRPASTGEEVVRFAEILMVCTNSNEPVLRGSDLQPGTHVTSIVHSNKEMLRAGLVTRMRREIDDETLRRARLAVTTSKGQEELDEPEVLYGAAQRGVLRWEEVAELADIVRGKVPVDEVHKEHGITFFKNAPGSGIAAGAVARAIYDRARERGVGIVLEGVPGFEPVY